MPSHFSPDDEETHEQVAECVAETGAAWCIRVVPLGSEKERDLWLPKSICSRDGNVFQMPLWIAEKERLV